MSSKSNPQKAEERIAIILARGGSKRLPDKNIRPLCGKPLIARTIETARASDCFSKVLLSTDSEKIAKIGKDFGAWVPFLRPAELAEDETSSTDALIHAVQWLQSQSDLPHIQTVALLQPTSPFLNVNHIRKAVSLFETGRFSSLGSMCEAHTPPEWMFSVLENRQAVPMFPDDIESDRKLLPTRLRENGALYLVNTDHLLTCHSLYDFTNHGAFIMSEADSIDIDTYEDWDLAEYFMAQKQVQIP